MYYRYKTKKKGNRVISVFFLLLLAGGAIYGGYQYRQYLFFWKYSYTKLHGRVEAAVRIGPAAERRAELERVLELVMNHAGDNPVSADTFFLAGRVHCLIGMSLLPGGFSDIIINDLLVPARGPARDHFSHAVRMIRKGRALSGDNILPPEVAVIMARASLHGGHAGAGEIVSLLDPEPVQAVLAGVEDRRMYAVVLVQTERADEGLDYLNRHGMIGDGLQGGLFLATMERMAGRFTDAIARYRDMIPGARDNRVLQLIHFNLGRLYYNQSLYQESLDEFNRCIEIDAGDTTTKIWIGKSYSAMGDEDRARAIWSEIMASDRSNREVRELLGVM